MAILLEDHIYRSEALTWLPNTTDEVIGFSRLTQMGVLRLLSTAAAMNGRPLSMRGAWRAYEKLFEDDRVALLAEPQGLDPSFRTQTSAGNASPKLWADAYLLAFATAHDGVLVTFDRALAKRAGKCALLLH
ncbi:MAG: hypothetical protein JO307_16500 [Bryobacterales bacterium]|nr:hypothetical protein [Bryobacterales bacterium]